MRLVPGDTKVKLEVFKGVRIWDLIVGLVSGLISVYIIVSDLTHKVFLVIPIIIITGFLIARIVEGEPTYERLLRVLRFFVFPKRFERIYTDDMLYEKAIGVLGSDFLDEYGIDKENEDPNAAKPKKETVKRVREELGDLLQPTHMMDDLMPFTGISAGCIEYDGLYYGAVLAIDPVEYRFLSGCTKST